MELTPAELAELQTIFKAECDEHLSALNGLLMSLEKRPDDVAALIWLGEMRLLQSRPEAAEPLFMKALSLQPRLTAPSRCSLTAATAGPCCAGPPPWKRWWSGWLMQY